MRENLTHIVFILDRSGSMTAIEHATIEGFNRFLATHKDAPGAATVTLIQFDNQYEVNYQMCDIQQVPLLTSSTFQPRGRTAYYDALGRAINETGQQLAAMAEADRPSKVLVVILTDGQENASTEFTESQIGAMREHQAEVYSWEFVYIGANQDAIATAAAIGIQPDMAMNFAATNVGTQNAFNSVANATMSFRSAPDGKVSFSVEDRKNAMGQ